MMRLLRCPLSYGLIRFAPLRVDHVVQQHQFVDPSDLIEE